MFGLKIRSWMETHLVRTRKKRNKDGGAKIKQEKSPPDHIAVVNNEFEYKSAKCIDSTKKISPVSTIKTQVSSTDRSSQQSSLKTQSGFTCVVNLSSPESAYSTGYSTDGTSPGASLPPEYYINIRSGTHYFQSNRPGEKLTPRSARRKREEAKRRKQGEGGQKHLPESSTEDEILNHDSTTEERLPSTHRRTESCDESNLSPPTALTSPPCSSPYLPGSSPRPRNRIRTNPWLPSSPGGSTKPAPGELSNPWLPSSPGGSNKIPSGHSPVDLSAVDSSSSSSGREKQGAIPPHRKVTSSPRKKLKDPSRGASPLVNRRNRDIPRSPHSVHHSSHLGSSSSPLSSSDEDPRGNTSDFSDEDVTLNEILGKYDESYTYEKETDILSDSDLTDVEETNLMGLEFLRRDARDDFDFIDNGSSVAQSENNSPMPGKRINTGHCYYHLLKQKSTDSRSSSRSSSVVKRSKKSDYERRRNSRNPSQEKLPPCHFKPCSPMPKNEKHFNMNKILAERLNQSQDRGTQSANTTPLSARKRLTDNGKYLKNDYITNLINSNVNLSEKNRNLSERKYSLTVTSSGSLEELQRNKRSNSLSQEISIEPDDLKYKKLTEDDLKYKKLTEEASYIIETLENCKLNSGQRRAQSVQSSPVRFSQSTSRSSQNISAKNLLESHPNPQLLLSRIRRSSQGNVPVNSDAEKRNIFNQTIDYGGKCWSPLKVKLLQQNHLDNRNAQNINLSSTSSPVKTWSNKKHTGSDISLYENSQNNSPKNFPRSLNMTERNQEVSRNLDLRNNNRNHETRGRVPVHHQHILDACQPENVMITLRNAHNPKIIENSNSVISNGSSLHHKYNGDPLYENIGMKTFSRQSTPTKSPYLSQRIPREFNMVVKDQPPKIPINTQTYKLAKSKPNAPLSPLFGQTQAKPTLTTFQRNVTMSNSYHAKSTADMLSDAPQKPILPRNFKSLDLGPQEADVYCPRSEPVKRKVYANSVTYGKLQKSLKGGNFLRDSDACNQLRNSVAQLRKERFYVEAKLRKAQQQINKIQNDF